MASTSFAGDIEFYYTLSPYTIKPLTDLDSPTINVGPSTIQPQTSAGWFFANNIVNIGASFIPISPVNLNGAWFTGLSLSNSSTSSQKLLTPNNGGVNLFQVNGGSIGMMLSTWGISRPYPMIGSSSLQFVKIFSDNPIPRPWSNDPSSLLCTNSIIDLHSWYGGSVQAMFTLKFFQHNNPNKWFFMNIMLLDTNPSNQPIDIVIKDNPHDTGAPIAISHAQTNAASNPNIRYSSPIPNYGAILGAYSKQSNRPASYNSYAQHYGFCISKAQFQTMLNDVNMKAPDMQISIHPEHWGLSGALISPEIAGEGDMGMSVTAMNVYRIYDN